MGREEQGLDLEGHPVRGVTPQGMRKLCQGCMGPTHPQH